MKSVKLVLALVACTVAFSAFAARNSKKVDDAKVELHKECERIVKIVLDSQVKMAEIGERIEKIKDQLKKEGLSEKEIENIEKEILNDLGLPIVQ